MLTENELFDLAVKSYEEEANDQHALSVSQREIREMLLKSLRPFLIIYGNKIQQKENK